MTGEGGASVRALTIMLVAGEPSGDQLGAQLMSALNKIGGANLRIVGIGGPAMSAQGLDSLFPLDDIAVMGIRDVMSRLPRIFARVKQAVDFALATRPDLIVLIDSPEFTHRIAKGIKRRNPSLRTVNYVAPQVWASRPHRAEEMTHYMDAVLTLFPFETKFFQQHGLKAIFVGYPVVERKARMTGGDEFRRRHNIEPDTKLLAVLPGSRRNEIRFILPPFKETVRRLAAEIPDMITVMPTVPHVAALVKEAAKDWPAALHIIEREEEKFAAFDAADAALAASGTVTMELALARTPMVVGYKTGWLTYAIGKRLMRVPYATLINLILGREAVPEFIQARCTPELLAEALRPLLTDETAHDAQLHAFDEALHGLGADSEAPSISAARAVLALAQNKT